MVEDEEEKVGEREERQWDLHQSERHGDTAEAEVRDGQVTNEHVPV